MTTSLIIIAIIGGIIGLIYGSGPERRIHPLVRFIIGALGGLLGVWFFGGVLGLVSQSATVSVLLAILWTIVGALIILAIVDAIAYSSYRARESRIERRAQPRRSRGYARDYDREREYRKDRDYEEVEEEHTVKKTKKK